MYSCVEGFFFCFFVFFFVFFVNDTATTEIYTLALHDALPIYYVSLNSHLHEKRNGYNKESDEQAAHSSTLCKERACSYLSASIHYVVWLFVRL